MPAQSHWTWSCPLWGWLTWLRWSGVRPSLSLQLMERVQPSSWEPGSSCGSALLCLPELLLELSWAQAQSPPGTHLTEELCLPAQATCCLLFGSYEPVAQHPMSLPGGGGGRWGGACSEELAGAPHSNLHGSPGSPSCSVALFLTSETDPPAPHICSSFNKTGIWIPQPLD